MTHDEAIRIISKKREGISTTAPLRQALDIAIASLERENKGDREYLSHKHLYGEYKPITEKATGYANVDDYVSKMLEREGEANKTIRAQAEENVAKVRGSYDAPGFEACVDAEVERLKADHFADASKMVHEKVQNTDSVEGITPTDTHERFVELPERLIKIMTDTKELTVEEQLAEAQATITMLQKELRTTKNSAELEASTLHARVKVLGMDKHVAQNDVVIVSDVAARSIELSESLRAILRNLLTLKWHKDTFGKTPEYLEAMPKVWEEAREAVK